MDRPKSIGEAHRRLVQMQGRIEELEAENTRLMSENDTVYQDASDFEAENQRLEGNHLVLVNEINRLRNVLQRVDGILRNDLYKNRVRDALIEIQYELEDE